MILKGKTIMSQFSPLGGFLFSLSSTSLSPTSSFLSRKQIIIAILCCPTEEIIILIYFLLPSLSLAVLLPTSSSDNQLHSTAPPPLFAPFCFCFSSASLLLLFCFSSLPFTSPSSSSYFSRFPLHSPACVHISANSKQLNGASSDGFRIMQQPAARAGTTLKKF